MAEEEISLRVLTEEEAGPVLAAFEVFKKAHGVTLNVSPVFTGDGRVAVDVRFLKVVEGPKEGGFQVEGNGKEGRDGTEETAGA